MQLTKWTSEQEKQSTYQPVISADIKTTNQKCTICTKFTKTVHKETLQSVETPLSSWEQLGLDIFNWKECIM